MPVLDDRGRLFGRINLIDAVVGAFAIVLIPVGYSAYLLFRTPIPTITSIEPAQITEQQPATVRVTGEDFRPYLGAKLGTNYGVFLLQDPMHAEIKVPPLPAGTYDLALFDEALELARKPGVLQVLPAPAPAPNPSAAASVELLLVGEFVNLSAEDASAIRTGLTLGPDGERPVARVLAAKSPTTDAYRLKVSPDAVVTIPRPGALRVPAIVRVICTVTNDQCSLAGTAVVRAGTLNLPFVDGRPDVSFLIGDVRPPDAPAEF